MEDIIQKRLEHSGSISETKKDYRSFSVAIMDANKTVSVVQVGHKGMMFVGVKSL